MKYRQIIIEQLIIYPKIHKIKVVYTVNSSLNRQDSVLSFQSLKIFCLHMKNIF